jgi:DNA mismatch repair ATPase MutS
MNVVLPIHNGECILLFKNKKISRKLEQSYGKPPDITYYNGDMEVIRTYFDYRFNNDVDDFLVDDITWNDLSGDEIFKHINHGLSSSGEQYLYYLLRSPAIKQEEYIKRSSLIEMMEQNPDLRIKLQVIFYNLGRRRTANTTEVFNPSTHNSYKLVFYVFYLVVFLGFIVSLFFTFALLPFLIALIIAAAIYHDYETKKIESNLATVNYSVNMIFTVKRLKKIVTPELYDYLASCFKAAERMKAITRIGTVPLKGGGGDMGDVLNIFLLLDLLIYESLKNHLGKHHKDIFHIHEYLGRIDSAIAIASYRKSLPTYSIPKIDFFYPSSINVNAIDLIHPLIDKPVPNSIVTDTSLLLTGSNASGKSTFLRTLAINAIFAQGICTVLAKQYSAPAFRTYSSMTITDNLLTNESYFISEIKSLKRIADADTSKQPLLCVIDEVLRGTNTVERIAASSELLKHIASENILCVAATHDIELCMLLSKQYRMLHFEENITSNGEVLFDYIIKDGQATTRNAIKLLKCMGFDKNLIKRANEKADYFTEKGTWYNRV